MYAPGVITTAYLIISNYYHTKKICPFATPIIVKNIMLTELIYLLTYWLIPPTENWNLLNIFPFLLTQELWYLSMHILMHHVNLLNNLHSEHHKYYGAFYAWCTTASDHLLKDMLSVIIPFYLFRMSSVLLLLVFVLKVFISIFNYTENNYYFSHIKNPTQLFGSMYLFDKCFNKLFSG